MQRILYLISLLYITCNYVSGQILWEVSGKGLRHKSYIFGTEKLIPISFLDSIPNLYECFGQCHTVVTEMQLNADVRDELTKAAILPEHRSLSSLYSAQDYYFIDSVLPITLHMERDIIRLFRPIFLTELFKTELFTQELNYKEEESSELFFQLVAVGQGKRIVALDNTAETIYMTFYSKNLDLQAMELLRLLQHPEAEIEHMQTLLRFYRSGRIYDIAYAIQAPSNKTTLNYVDYQTIAKRNGRWVQQLPSIMQNGSCFIVLNVNCLGGDEGLIQSLRQAGYRVRPVNRLRLSKTIK